MGDLTNPKAIWTKGVLFLLLGIVTAVLLLVEAPTLRVAVLLSIPSWTAVWGFCRAYYCAFYVIEKYVDREYRFSGIISFIGYCLKRRGKKSRGDSQG